jgi:hypothetical protein
MMSVLPGMTRIFIVAAEGGHGEPPLQKLFVTGLVLAVFVSLSVQQMTGQDHRQQPRGSLEEVREKRWALLIVSKSAVVDVRNEEQGILDFILRADPEPRGRHQWVYWKMARKLDSYTRKYHSLVMTPDITDAEYVIFFNIAEYRTILNTQYPYGELFVIVKGVPEIQRPPHVIWRSNKIVYAGDAIRDLIRELKLIRGEY